MAYDYLGLVNDLCNVFNEVELDSSNFATALGEYANFKRAVNRSIRKINTHEFEWPFFCATEDKTLTSGTSRYAFPSNTKTIDWDSFRLKADDTLGNSTRYLYQLDYEEYLQKFVDQEYSDSFSGIPRAVVRTPDDNYLIHPEPDANYLIAFEYYTLFTDLSAYDDTPTIPEKMRHVINSGSEYYAYRFRGDMENQQLAWELFKEDLKDAEGLYRNRYEYMRSGYIPHRRWVSSPTAFYY